MTVSPAIRGIFAITFLALSIGGLYVFRILPAQRGLPIHMETYVKNRQLGVPFQWVKIPERLTGFKPIDGTLGMLVTAFSYGVLRLDEDAYFHHLHFLLQFFAIIAVMTIEAYRPRNTGALITYTSVVAFFYQTIGGAFVLPLYALGFLYATSGSTYLRAGRPLQLYVAKALLPAMLIGFLLPTILVYIPRESYVTNLYFNAIWQFSPIYVNALMGNFSGLVNAFTSNKNITPTSDLSYVRTTYLVSILVSFAVHAYAISGILMGNPNEVSLKSVFIPSLDRLGKSTSQDLHFIFQVDWIVCAVTMLLLALYTIIQIQAQQSSLGIKSDAGRIVALMAVLTVLTGPGGALAAGWWWRENALVEIEAKIAVKAISEKKK